MPISWKNYIGIRKIDEKNYFKVHNIENYSQLLSRINTGDVVPPQESEVAHLFVKKEVVDKSVETVAGVKETTVEKVAKKPAIKKTKKPVSKTNQKTDVSKRKPKPKPRTRKAAPKKSTK